MPFIGNIPTAIPLTGADIEDGTIQLSDLSATGTKDSTTFLRGDNTFAEAGGGKILQVVQTSKTDTFSSTSTGTNDITGMSVTITPSASDSKILILGTICTDATNNANIRLFRGSTLISVGDAASNRTRSSAGEGRASGSAGQDFVSNSLTFLDSPATTSATTYKVGYYMWTSGGTFYLNRSASDTDNAYEWRAASNIIAIEVGA